MPEARHGSFGVARTSLSKLVDESSPCWVVYTYSCSVVDLLLLVVVAVVGDYIMISKY